MHRIVALSILGCAVAGGCAHHANQYAYAPPLAPPVYPQPQAAALPVASPTPGPVVAAPAMPVAPVGGVPVTAADGFVPANADGSCPPCATGTVTPVVYEQGMQTTPCPPGP